MNSLISVSNRKNLPKLFKFISNNGHNVYATSGTYQALNLYNKKNNLIDLQTKIGYSNLFGGRVKSFHPFVYGGLLADTDNESHLKDMENEDIPKFNLAVINLYPFEQTVKSKHNHSTIIENIDIGGHSMMRAAAKNYKDTVILSDPSQYKNYLDNYQDIHDCELARKYFAEQAFCKTLEYDMEIQKYFAEKQNNTVYRKYHQIQLLKNGCNNYQKPANLYVIANKEKNKPFKVLNGKLGYINVLDALNSYRLANEINTIFDKPAATSFKHTSPAGVAYADTVEKAYKNARGCDPKSSFGDFIGISDTVDVKLAKYLKSQVSDGIIANSYTDDALEILKKKKGGKYLILEGNKKWFRENREEFREINGVVISQKSNNTIIHPKTIIDGVLTKMKELEYSCYNDLLLATQTLKYTQSNSVVVAYNGKTIGVGAGQQSRVDCLELACKKAYNHILLTKYLATDMFIEMKKQDRINAIAKYITENNNKDKFDGLSLASDGFFPFRDNIDLAAQYGINYISQPGGSMRDNEIIDACNEHDIIMSLTDKRMFYH
jgi:phosphoribosylaminoimidazolecarboxamide formyltransferase / IMP cyclohydrolase